MIAAGELPPGRLWPDPQPKEKSMAWISPKYFDTPVGMEINMYALADEK